MNKRIDIPSELYEDEVVCFLADRYHIQKYKQGTLHMVKTLVLSDQTPLDPANRINNFIQ